MKKIKIFAFQNFHMWIFFQSRKKYVIDKILKINILSFDEKAENIANFILKEEEKQIAARIANDHGSDSNFNIEVSEKGKNKISKEIADAILTSTGKTVSNNKAYAIYDKGFKFICNKVEKAVITKEFYGNINHVEYRNLLKKIEREMALKINTVIKTVVNEEIADYFAAILLVPAERFILWEDKPDDVIADAFDVPVECIENRRKEVELENNLMINDYYLS